MDGLQSPIRKTANNDFSKQRHRNMELKWLEEYRKEYRESWSATIEKADAKHEENFFERNEIRLPQAQARSRQ
jgi:type III secretory pathway component EscR